MAALSCPEVTQHVRTIRQQQATGLQSKARLDGSWSESFASEHTNAEKRSWHQVLGQDITDRVTSNIFQERRG